METRPALRESARFTLYTARHSNRWFRHKPCPLKPFRCNNAIMLRAGCGAAAGKWYEIAVVRAFDRWLRCHVLTGTKRCISLPYDVGGERTVRGESVYTGLRVCLVRWSATEGHVNNEDTGDTGRSAYTALARSFVTLTCSVIFRGTVFGKNARWNCFPIASPC